VRTIKSKSAAVKRARQFALIIAPSVHQHWRCRSQLCSRRRLFPFDSLVKNVPWAQWFQSFARICKATVAPH